MVRRQGKRVKARWMLPIFALTALFASASNAGINHNQKFEDEAPGLKGDRLRGAIPVTAADVAIAKPAPLTKAEEAAIRARFDAAFPDPVRDSYIQSRIDEAFDVRPYGVAAAVTTFKTYNDMLPFITDATWAKVKERRPSPEVVGAKPVKRLSTVAACRKIFGRKAYFNTALESDAEAQFGLEPGALAITARIESTNDPCAYSKDRAMGLYQIIPDKAHELQGDPFDPKIAPYMAASILSNCGKLARWLGISSEFQEAARYACYHSGEGVLDKMVKRKGDFTMAALGKWGKDYVRKHDAARDGRLLDPVKANQRMLANNEALRAIDAIIMTNSGKIAAGMPAYVTAYRR